MEPKSQTKNPTNPEISFLRSEQNVPLSFQKCLINVDVIAIRSKRTYETVIILYIGAWKVGFIYEGGNLTDDQILRFYNDAPKNFNDLKHFEKEFGERVDIMVPKKDNYVFIGERIVEKIKTINNK